MKMNTLAWGVTIFGLTVGLSSLAMGGQNTVKKSPEPSALPAKSALLSKKAGRGPKRLSIRRWSGSPMTNRSLLQKSPSLCINLLVGELRGGEWVVAHEGLRRGCLFCMP